MSRIALIHLSDLHFSIETQSGISFKFDKLFNALRGIEEDVKYYFITITGDLTCSGASSEYALLKIILNQFIDKLRKETNKDIYLLCVPGNHDVDHASEKHKCNILDVYKNNKYVEEISSQLKLLKNYNKFADSYDCGVTDNQLIQSRLISIENGEIEFLLVNNAVFSQKDCQNYKGLLYLADRDIDQITKYKDACFSVSLMHHNLDYFNDDVKHKAKKTILLKSSIVLLGHEHEGEGIEAVSGDSHTEIHMAGAFCDRENSSLSVYIINTDRKTLKPYYLTWCNEGEGYYSIHKEKEKPIALKRYNDTFLTYDANYLLHIEESHRFRDLGKLNGYYVFPRLVEENHSGEDRYYHEIKSIEDFNDLLEKNSKLKITGNANCGKTSLLKFLFLQKNDRSFGKYPLLFCPNDFISSNPETILNKKIRESFSNTHKDSLMYYLQLNENDKILMIDDYDLIEDSVLQKFLQKYGSSFKYHIYTTHNSILDFRQSIKDSIIDENIKFFRITPFLSDKRDELITKVVEISYPQKTDSIEGIAKSFSTNRSVLSATPSFVIMFCNFYCGSFGSNTSDSNIYSKVFESNLIDNLHKIQTPRMPVEKIFIVLQKIAFYTFLYHKNSITEMEIDGIITDYEKEYITTIDHGFFLAGITKTPIIRKKDDFEYQFSDRDILAYFIAQEICSIDDDNQRNSIIIEIIKNSCLNINSSILLFIFHIQQDTVLLTTMIQEVSKYVDSWDSFSFNDSSMPAFIARKESLALEFDEIKKDNYYEKEQEERLNKEKKIEELANQSEKKDFYQNDNSDIESPFNKLLRACNLMYVLSKCLPIFEYKLRGDNKNRLAQLIFSLPNKIFNVWTVLFTSAKESIINELKRTWISYHSDSVVFPKTKVEFLLWWESLSLLISLYDNSCGIATSDNTKDFLLEYKKDSTDDTMKIQRLVICSQVSSSPAQFYDIAKGLINRKDEPAYTVIRRIILHGILHISNLDTSKARSLASSYFGKNDSDIMKERMKLEQKKKRIKD